MTVHMEKHNAMKKSGYMSGAAGRGRGMALAAGMLLAVMQMYAQPKVVGHRGCRFNTPDDPGTLLYENTLPALGFAQELGVDAVEFDVQLTSDGKVIVFHGMERALGDQRMTILFHTQKGTVALPGLRGRENLVTRAPFPGRLGGYEAAVLMG